jgi:hypothetical protein
MLKDEPLLSRAEELLVVNRPKLKVAVGLLTGYTTFACLNWDWWHSTN